MHGRLKIATLSLFALCLAGVVGCSAKEEPRMTAAHVRRNLSPEMVGLARTHDNRKNDIARTFNTNRRSLMDDVDSLLLIDRPSHTAYLLVP